MLKLMLFAEKTVGRAAGRWTEGLGWQSLEMYQAAKSPFLMETIY